MNKRRIKDVTNNEIIENFLDCNVYPMLPYSITRNLGTKANLKGIDILLSKNVNDLYVDEKIATRYINKDLKTFSFELSSSNNVNNSGWFLKNNYNLTSYYLIGYLKGNLNKKEINEVELLLLSKSKMWEYLNKNKFNLKYIESIRNGNAHPINSKKGRDYYYTGIEGTKIVHSKQLIESPINILFDKKLLIKLCDNHFLYKKKILNIL